MTKKIIVSNPGNLATIDFHKLKILQTDLKTLSEENLTKLCNSIKRYKYFVPAFVWRSGNDFWILDATQRYHALEHLEKEGYEIPEIPYIEIEAKDRKDAAEKLLQITSRYGEINQETTFFEDFNIDLTFINDIEIPELDIKLDDLIPEIVEDEVPEPPTEPLSKTGDLWCCGNRHRILCGDATNETDIERLMDGKKADLVFTDPPFNIDIKYKNYQDKDEQYWNKVGIWMALIKQFSKSNFSIYIKQYTFNLLNALLSFVKAEFEIKNVIIWKSQSMAHPTQNYDNAYEIIIYGIKGTPSFDTWGEKREKPDNYWSGKGVEFKGKMTNLWADIAPVAAGCLSMSDMETIDNQKQHITEMPIKLPARAISFSSKENDLIADFFLGSGMTLIAAEQTKRICYGCEIDPHYIDVILDRYAKFTGNDPVRESDNVKWSELKKKQVTESPLRAYV